MIEEFLNHLKELFEEAGVNADLHIGDITADQASGLAVAFGYAAEDAKHRALDLRRHMRSLK